jgi:hypothetical protein
MLSVAMLRFILARCANSSRQRVEAPRTTWRLSRVFSLEEDATNASNAVHVYLQQEDKVYSCGLTPGITRPPAHHT